MPSGSPQGRKVLVVDDDERNRLLMEVILSKNGYDCRLSVNGREALEKARSSPPDLIFLDVMMPVMDGFEACRQLKADPATSHIPVVIVTALSDQDSRLKGLEAGANDFLTKPLDSTELLVRARNLVKVKVYEDFLKDFNSLLAGEVEKKTLQLREGYLDTIHRLTRVAEYKDEQTSQHINRVGELCALVAEELGWSGEQVETIRHAAPMHDIGKITIPSDILLKPGPLLPEEFALMKIHAVMGGEILSNGSSVFLQMAERIALTHHERYGGGGYPKGLKGEDIPLEGRIMNLADQYDALRSARPYKPPRDHETVCRIILEGDGRTSPGDFDPRLLEVFRRRSNLFGQIYDGGA